MEEAVAEHLVEEGGGGLGEDGADIVAGGDERGAVVDADADDALQRQHALAGAPPVDARHAEIGIAGEILGELGGGGGFEPQIHLDAHRLGEGAHDLDRLQAAQARLGALDEAGEPEEEVDVAREGGGDAGAQDLDRDLLAVGGDGEMDLGDRGGGDRHVLEGGEEALRSARPNSASTMARAASPGKRRQTILQLRQVGGDLLAEEIGAGRQELAELDEAGAERVQRRGEALARPRRGEHGIARAQQAQDARAAAAARRRGRAGKARRGAPG